MENNVSKIVFDGGPGSGKTSGMVQIREICMELGILTLFVPEAATMLMDAGIHPKNVPNIYFQKKILETQLSNENLFWKMAQELAEESRRKVAIIHDRGLLSGAAYLDTNYHLRDFQEKVLDEYDLDIETLRSRYDSIIHLVTAAEGAPEFYVTNNNRKETREEARALDKRTKSVWLGHGHLSVIGNTNEYGMQITFEQKMHALKEQVLHNLGYPEPIEIEDRYLLRSFNPAKLTGMHIPFEKIEIVQDYILPAKNNHTGKYNDQERIRRRTWEGWHSYVHTVKNINPYGPGKIETEANLSIKGYNAYLRKRLKDARTICKDRYCFIWQDQYFEVDVYKNLLVGLIILEREKTKVNTTTKLPDFLDVIEKITEDESYSNYALAHR